MRYKNITPRNIDVTINTKINKGEVATFPHPTSHPNTMINKRYYCFSENLTSQVADHVTVRDRILCITVAVGELPSNY